MRRAACALLLVASIGPARAGTATSPEVSDPAGDTQQSFVAEVPPNTDSTQPGDPATVDIRSAWFSAIKTGATTTGFTVHLRMWNSIDSAKTGTQYSVAWLAAGGCDDVPQGAVAVRGIVSFRVGSTAVGTHDCGNWVGANGNDVGIGCYCESFTVSAFRQPDDRTLEWDVRLSDASAGLGDGGYDVGNTLSSFDVRAVTTGVAALVAWSDHATSVATYTI